jgi:ribonucleoside-diphosphate reductase alpha chain
VVGVSGGDPVADRPDVLPSATQEIDTGWGPVYVTVTEDPAGEPFEVFVVTGASGDIYNAQAEALGKACSTALRAAEDRSAVASELADRLIGIRTDRVSEDSGDDVLSIPDSVGLALRRHLEGAYGAAVKTPEDGNGEPGDLP